MLHVVGDTDTKEPDPTGPVLDLHVTSLIYGDAPVLGEVLLKINQSETLALVGPSGIGKTTLLRVIAGLETSFRGRCDVAGQVAMVFQEPTLLPWRSVRDNICIPTGVSEDEADQGGEESEQ